MRQIDAQTAVTVAILLLGRIVCIAQMWPIATDVWRGRCVGHVTDRYPAKTAGPIEMPFGMWGGVDHSNHVLDGGPDPSTERGNFKVGKGLSRSKLWG